MYCKTLHDIYDRVYMTGNENL